MQECLYFIFLSPRLLSFNFHVRYHTYTQYTVLSHSSLTVNPLYLHSSILSRYSLTVNPLYPYSYFLSRYSLTVNPLSPHSYFLSHYSLSHLFYLAPLYTLLLQFTHCLCLSLSFSPFASQFLSLYSSMLPNLAFL